MTSDSQTPITEAETNWFSGLKPTQIILNETQWNEFVAALEQEPSPEEFSRLRRLFQAKSPWEQ